MWAVLFAGMFLTYLLQMGKLARKGTSRGLSSQYLVLRTLGRLYALCSIVMLEANTIHCCTRGACFVALAGVMFMLAQFVLVWAM